MRDNLTKAKNIKIKNNEHANDANETSAYVRLITRRNRTRIFACGRVEEMRPLFISILTGCVNADPAK